MFKIILLFFCLFEKIRGRNRSIFFNSATTFLLPTLFNHLLTNKLTLITGNILANLPHLDPNLPKIPLALVLILAPCAPLQSLPYLVLYFPQCPPDCFQALSSPHFHTPHLLYNFALHLHNLTQLPHQFLVLVQLPLEGRQEIDKAIC